MDIFGWYTNLPLAVIEAMTIGMPVVALATTELPTVIEPGVTGYVSCDPDELIAWMRDLFPRRCQSSPRRMGAAGPRWRGFSNPQALETWEQITIAKVEYCSAEPWAFKRTHHVSPVMDVLASRQLSPYVACSPARRSAMAR